MLRWTIIIVYTLKKHWLSDEAYFQGEPTRNKTISDAPFPDNT